MLWYEIAFLVLLILHFLFCVILLIGMCLRIFPVQKLLFPIALLLPFWGPLAVLILSLQIFIKQTQVGAIGVESFKLDSELYKSLSRGSNALDKSTVSMEEALIVNSAKERRALIMDILNDNPKAYVDFLKMAGNNEDTEVVHYAVTAMVDISKENDRRLWEFEQQYAGDPDNYENLTLYCDFLWECLEQGLMQGQVERMNRHLYHKLITEKLAVDPPQLTDYARCIENCLKLKNYTDAGVILEKAREKYPRSEALIVLNVQYAADLRHPELLDELLAEIKRDNIYLSVGAKEVIAFWKE